MENEEIEKKLNDLEERVKKLEEKENDEGGK